MTDPIVTIYIPDHAIALIFWTATACACFWAGVEILLRTARHVPRVRAFLDREKAAPAAPRARVSLDKDTPDAGN